MALPLKLIAAITTTTAAASAAAYITISSRNTAPAPPDSGTAVIQRSATSSAPAPTGPDAGPDDVTLCVGSGRILRVPPGFADACPDGQQELLLAWDSDERLCDLCDPFKDPEPDEPGSDNGALEDLERRVRALENRSYFEVVNSKEQPILQVTPRGVRILNGEQQSVAFVATFDGGSSFTARSSGGQEASLSAIDQSVGVLLGDGSATRVEVGSRNGGPFALRLPAGQGLIAGIGQSRSGAGAVVVGTLPGVTQGSFTVTDGRGMVSLSKEGRDGGAALTEATIGGGLLDISNNAGNSAVKMGHNEHRYGIVMAGPILGPPHMPRSALPGSYFMGCASGQQPACTPTLP